MKKITFVIVLMIIFLVVHLVHYNFISQEDVKQEDISSYLIKNRYDCKQIQEPTEYNKCVRFYSSNTPYSLGDQIVPIKLIS